MIFASEVPAIVWTAYVCMDQEMIGGCFEILQSSSQSVSEELLVLWLLLTPSDSSDSLWLLLTPPPEQQQGEDGAERDQLYASTCPVLCLSAWGLDKWVYHLRYWIREKNQHLKGFKNERTYHTAYGYDTLYQHLILSSMEMLRELMYQIPSSDKYVCVDWLCCLWKYYFV